VAASRATAGGFAWLMQANKRALASRS
jgi:hypothetical protein